MPVRPPHPSTLEAGTLVGVNGAHGHASGVHVGVVSGRLDEYGLPLVIAPSHRAGRVQEESWLTFTEGKEARVFGSSVARSVVLARARARIGQPAGDVASCDQFLATLRGDNGAGAALAGAAIGLAAVAVIAGALMLLVDDTDERGPAPRRRAATG